METRVTLAESFRRTQLEWAKGQAGPPADEKGYFLTVSPNLFRPMSRETAADFGSGSGGELRPGRRRRPKMFALHSSSILACNVFDYWRANGAGLVGEAFEWPFLPDRLTFEAKFPTGLPGEPPNVDVVLWATADNVLAIESKFTEPFGRPKSSPPFKAKYFPDGQPIWMDRDLPVCADLALNLQEGRVRYRHLDAAQLLKHILGLQARRPRAFTLAYVYVDDAGEDGDRHRREVADFSGRIAAEIPFHAVSYQSLVARLRALAGAYHDPYFAYLASRYQFRAT